ncbi:MAG: ribonuclease P protein component [Candidatus Spechtbacteria bacterium]|nr:ribonuclease P protein component [Candidatus Spechtbacteria bacterium]
MPTKRLLALRGSYNIQNLFSKGRVIKTPHFLIRYKEKKDDSVRAGVIVTKKIAKKAVQRNKIKRQVRECLRSVADFFIGGVDVIVIPNSIDMEFQDMKNEIILALKTSRLIIIKE